MKLQKGLQRWRLRKLLVKRPSKKVFNLGGLFVSVVGWGTFSNHSLLFLHSQDKGSEEEGNSGKTRGKR